MLGSYLQYILPGEIAMYIRTERFNDYPAPDRPLSETSRPANDSLTPQPAPPYFSSIKRKGP